jgi:HlyD family type I secretion membrane fusion protein
MRLDDLETGSTVALLESQFHALMAQEARLEAERDGQPEVRLPPSLIGRRGDSMAADILAGQERIFAGRRSSLAGREAVTRQQITQLEAQIAALTAQRTAGQRQIALVREESAGVEELVAKGLERKPRLLALQRQGAELEGMQGNLIHRITEAREAIAQAELEILSLKADRHSEVVAELYDVQNRRIEAEEKLKAAQMRRNRRDVVAPESGTVMKLRHFAPGAVVAPGGDILDLVPQDDRLVIDARVSPIDIDVVRVGLPAGVVLTAYKSRTTPKLDGQVVRVSADALTDERTGMPYYLARVIIDAEQLNALDGVHLQPGMPAETQIFTGKRTMLKYLLQPIEDSFRRAFREE